MARAPKVCAEQGCPTLTPGRYCTDHERARDKARGTAEQRGYGRDYQRSRRQAKAKVKQGGVNCWRCGQPIDPNETWHHGHDDDRDIIRGPEHELCNLSAAGKARHRN